MFFLVTLNGTILQRWLTKADAYAMAERWQGQHGGYHGGSGLTKIKDRRDYLEVKPDHEANKEFNARYQAAKNGERQVVQYEQRIED